jgi:hypothetical protein
MESAMIQFSCDCGRKLKVKDDLAGRKIKCPECAEVLRVPAADVPEADDGDEEGIVPASPRISAVKRRPARDEEDSTERERPRRRRDEVNNDDDDDERPRKKKKKKKSSNNGLLIGIVVGVVVLVIGGGMGLFFLLKPKKEADKVPVAGAGGPVPGKGMFAAKGMAPVGGGLSGIAQTPGKLLLENNLKQLGLAMHIHFDVHQRLPSPGFSSDPKAKGTKPLLSWRVAILPYIDQEALFKQFKLNEPWDGPNNSKLLSRMPKVFEAVLPQPASPGNTYLQLVTGPGTLYPSPSAAPKLIGSIPDGTSNTVIIVEAAEAVPWTKPADYTIDVSNIRQGAVPKLGAFSADGFFVAMGDGSTRFVDRRRVSDKSIRQAFNPADGMAFDQDWFQ